MRLAKYLAHAGACSRREATRRISQGRVTIDGRIANHTDMVAAIEPNQNANTHINVPSPMHKICCDGQEILGFQPLTYWLFNKPVGVDCRLLPERSDSLYHFIAHLPRLYPVGRLDKDSRGLLLLTNDGDLCHQLMHPSFAHQKTYRVTVDKPIDSEFVSNMSRGVSYKNVTTLPCQVTPLSIDQFEIVLTQGLNRQIRRMSQALGRRAIDLQRTAIGGSSLEQGDLQTLKEGELRQIYTAEVSSLLCNSVSIADIG